MEAIGMVSGLAFNLLVNAKLVGDVPKTLTYSVTGSKATNMIEHKWNIHMENIVNTLTIVNMCVDGGLKYPTKGQKDNKLTYYNNFGFGSTCQQYFVNMVGESLTSQEQINFSKQSESSSLCQKWTNSAQKLSNALQNMISFTSSQQSSELINIQSSLSQAISNKENYCEKQKEEAATLDTLLFSVTTSKDLPPYIYTAAKYLNTGVKSFFLQYLSEVGLPVGEDVKLKLVFNPAVKAVTMTVFTPEDSVTYKNIRLPYILKTLLPVTVHLPLVESSYKSVTGSALYPRCSYNQGHITTFDNKTYTYSLDDCYHIISSDCSSEFDHAVLAKEVGGAKHVKIFHQESLISFKYPLQSVFGSVSTLDIVCDNKVYYLIPNSVLSIESKNGQVFSFYRSLEGMIEIETPSSRVSVEGMKITVEDKNIINDGMHCGLCGDNNKDGRADLKSPSGCIHKTDYLSAVSYRVQDSQCSSLPFNIQQSLQKEQEDCVKYQVRSSSLSGLYKTISQHSNMIKKHAHIYKSDKVCISQLPVVECAVGTVPKVSKSKVINFVCFNSRVGMRYMERVSKGEILKELSSSKVNTSFGTEMKIPISCGTPTLF